MSVKKKKNEYTTKQTKILSSEKKRKIHKTNRKS